MGNTVGGLWGHTDMDFYHFHFLTGRLYWGPDSRANVNTFREVWLILLLYSIIYMLKFMFHANCFILYLFRFDYLNVKNE